MNRLCGGHPPFSTLAHAPVPYFGHATQDGGSAGSRPSRTDDREERPLGGGRGGPRRSRG